jgi:hypothetical protein
MAEGAQQRAEQLGHYDVPALIAEALAMGDPCPNFKCVAPTVHLLAALLREAVERVEAAEADRDNAWRSYNRAMIRVQDSEVRVGVLVRELKVREAEWKRLLSVEATENEELYGLVWVLEEALRQIAENRFQGLGGEIIDSMSEVARAALAASVEEQT